MNRLLDFLLLILSAVITIAFFLTFVPRAYSGEITFGWSYPTTETEVIGFNIHRYQMPDKTGREVVTPRIPAAARTAFIITPTDDVCFSYWITAISLTEESGPSSKVVVCNDGEHVTINFIEERR